MEVPEKLLKFKFHLFFALAFALFIFSLVCHAPRFVDVIAYFWPLLVSTALFLAAAVVFGRTSPPAAEVPGEKAAEGILDFVAGQPEPVEAEEDAKAEDKIIVNPRATSDTVQM
ncbi:hypothetical protein RJ639_007890 [Escallonia herrerae]|uniref:Transmembrane protein n=1 Tax=Escallonia herrerae TaxID=1293975 RepID=A0AA89AVN8_9ASTE|nr:hypothetical protein RJ639_007890 [Escallonia herrerae]